MQLRAVRGEGLSGLLRKVRVWGMSERAYKPLFPYFGGKARIAHEVWAALGDAPNYVEPFFGSGATLFLRPGGAGNVETVNDADGLLANVWRAIRHAPDEVAQHADNPVNECDLHARHLWLVGQRERITERLCGDPDYFDAKAAGWWVWGQCCWIGSGWCSGNGPWTSENGEFVLRNPGQGVKRQLPDLGGPGKGVNRKRPGSDNACKRHAEHLREQIRWFADRLRRVRVCCGDWARVCGSTTTTTKHGLTGVFLDPPYADTAGRNSDLYALDSLSVAHDVREWCIERGDNPKFRIVLAGYEGEHEMPDSWRVVAWKANGGYGSQAKDSSAGKENCHRERLWLSPHCVEAENESSLFAEAVA